MKRFKVDLLTLGMKPHPGILPGNDPLLMPATLIFLLYLFNGKYKDMLPKMWMGA